MVLFKATGKLSEKSYLITGDTALSALASDLKDGQEEIKKLGKIAKFAFKAMGGEKILSDLRGALDNFKKQRGDKKDIKTPEDLKKVIRAGELFAKTIEKTASPYKKHIDSKSIEGLEMCLEMSLKNLSVYEDAVEDDMESNKGIINKIFT